MSSWAKPGVKCVCLKVEPWLVDDGSRRPANLGPRTNEICTVRAVLESPTRGIGLTFLEHVAPDHTPIFPIRFFRPLTESTDDVALFAHHLDRVGEPA